jgi:hypothetical protein
MTTTMCLLSIDGVVGDLIATALLSMYGMYRSRGGTMEFSVLGFQT